MEEKEGKACYSEALGFLIECFMPTILRIDGLRIVIYPNDHSPEHVHVIGAGCEAVFELHCSEGPVTLRESYGFTTRQLRRVMDQLNAELFELCSAWESIHESD
jgi:uncharacterized protein DUF4160